MDTLSQTENRNEQFDKIKVYRQQFTDMNFPVLSIDTKKKEMLGNFCRSGTCYSQDMRWVNDHDFASSSDGQIVPHGIYDVNTNTGYVTLGTTRTLLNSFAKISIVCGIGIYNTNIQMRIQS